MNDKKLMDKTHVFVQVSPIESLTNRCLNTLVELIKSNKIETKELKNLPRNLLKIILNTFSKRGLLTDQNIDVFLNEQTRVLELSECSKISDIGLHKISICKYLSKIDLNSNSVIRELITSDGVSNLVKNCQNLHAILLRRCILIDDKCIETIVNNCPRLAYLNIGNCPLITDKSLKALGDKCQNLKSVNFTATKITDKGIFSLMSPTVSKTIEEVHLAHCDWITDESIECILMNSKTIKYLLYHSCPKTTDISRIALEDYMANNTNSKVKHLTWTIY